VWLAYFNSIVMGGAGSAEGAAGVQGAASGSPSSAAVQTPAAAAAAPAGPGIWTRIREGFGSVGHFFSGPSQYSIQPRQ
jgi:hypothetical protein